MVRFLFIKHTISLRVYVLTGLFKQQIRCMSNFFSFLFFHSFVNNWLTYIVLPTPANSIQWVEQTRFARAIRMKQKKECCFCITPSLSPF